MDRNEELQEGIDYGDDPRVEELNVKLENYEY